MSARPTGQAFFLAGLGVALLLAGLAFLRGGLVILSIPLLVYLGAAWILAPRRIRLGATRALEPRQVRPGEAVRVRLAVQNLGQDLAEVLVEDHLPTGVSLLHGEARQTRMLKRGERLDLEYWVEGKRGSYTFPEPRIQVREGLGLFQKETSLPATGELVVLPELRRLRRPLWIRPKKTHGFAGPIPARQGGAGTDFWGLREYQVGDPWRRINWRASAHLERELVVNEFEQERIADVGLILDARERAYPAGERERLFEAAIQATAALAETFLAEGNRVSLLVYGSVVLRTFPGYGKVQMERISQTLAGATCACGTGAGRTGHNFALETLEQIPARFFSPRSQIVLVSPLREEDPPVLAGLVSHGYQVLVASPNPLPNVGIRGVSQTTAARLGRRLAQLERRLLLERLEGFGIRVVDWDTGRPFEEAMDRFSRRTFSGKFWMGVSK